MTKVSLISAAVCVMSVISVIRAIDRTVPDDIQLWGGRARNAWQ